MSDRDELHPSSTGRPQPGDPLGQHGHQRQDADVYLLPAHRPPSDSPGSSSPERADTGTPRRRATAGSWTICATRQVRASYVLPLERPVTLSFFGRAQHGENHDFTLQPTRSVFRSGEVEREFIPPRDRDFEREGFSWGLTLTGSPHDRLTLFASGFQHRDDQDIDFFRSTALRYEEPFALFNTFVDLDFFKDSTLRYRSDHWTLILGGSFQITKRTETSLAYTFTRTNTRFAPDGLTASTLEDWSRIRNDIHRVQFEVGHWLREGLRVSFGYSYDKYDDRTSIPTGVGSADPFDPSTHVHTFMLA